MIISFHKRSCCLTIMMYDNNICSSYVFHTASRCAYVLVFKLLKLVTSVPLCLIQQDSTNYRMIHCRFRWGRPSLLDVMCFCSRWSDETRFSLWRCILLNNTAPEYQRKHEKHKTLSYQGRGNMACRPEITIIVSKCVDALRVPRRPRGSSD